MQLETDNMQQISLMRIFVRQRVDFMCYSVFVTEIVMLITPKKQSLSDLSVHTVVVDQHNQSRVGWIVVAFFLTIALVCSVLWFVLYIVCFMTPYMC